MGYFCTSYVCAHHFSERRVLTSVRTVVADLDWVNFQNSAWEIGSYRSGTPPRKLPYPSQPNPGPHRDETLCSISASYPIVPIVEQVANDS